MSEAQYGEPWRRPNELTVERASGRFVCATPVPDDAARIVACVNALRGVPEDQLAGLRVDNLIRLAEVVAEKFEGTDSPLGYLARGALSKEPR